MRPPASSGLREPRRWLAPLLLSAALLVFPILAWWWLTPGPTIRAQTPREPVAAATHEAAPAVDEPLRERRPVPVARDAGPLPAGPEGELVGLVYDPEGKPVEGAAVHCEDAEGGTRTDRAGRFTIAAADAGCRFIAEAAGFAPSPPGRLVAGIELALRLREGGGLAGTVVDEQGAPVTKYAIAIESFVKDEDTRVPGGLERARPVSDPGGAFRLEGLLPGRYVLSATAEGHPPATSEAARVVPGKTTEGLRIELGRGAALVGRVLGGSARAPIEGARVRLEGATVSGGAAAGTTSDREGSFRLEGVPAGPFSVRVEKEGYRARIIPGLVTGGAPELRRDLAIEATDGGDDTELTGIGVFVGEAKKGIVILGLVPDGPAAKAGLRVGDRVARIDGTPTEGTLVAQCTQRIRGPAGSSVSLSIVHADGSELEITITRETIVWPSKGGLPLERIARAERPIRDPV